MSDSPRDAGGGVAERPRRLRADVVRGRTFFDEDLRRSRPAAAVGELRGNLNDGKIASDVDLEAPHVCPQFRLGADIGRSGKTALLQRFDQATLKKARQWIGPLHAGKNGDAVVGRTNDDSIRRGRSDRSRLRDEDRRTAAQCAAAQCAGVGRQVEGLARLLGAGRQE